MKTTRRADVATIGENSVDSIGSANWLRVGQAYTFAPM